MAWKRGGKRLRGGRVYRNEAVVERQLLELENLARQRIGRRQLGNENERAKQRDSGKMDRSHYTPPSRWTRRPRDEKSLSGIASDNDQVHNCPTSARCTRSEPVVISILHLEMERRAGYVCCLDRRLFK